MHITKGNSKPFTLFLLLINTDPFSFTLDLYPILTFHPNLRSIKISNSDASL
jgi:hypothetical protein